MREFKVIRMNAARTGLVEEELMFRDMDAADNWANDENAKQPGAVVDVQETDFNVNESKYEY